jgi:hypothetical protein
VFSSHGLALTKKKSHEADGSLATESHSEGETTVSEPPGSPASENLPTPPPAGEGGSSDVPDVWA